MSHIVLRPTSRILPEEAQSQVFNFIDDQTRLSGASITVICGTDYFVPLRRNLGTE